MNYQFFDVLYTKFECDAIKVIGKDVEHNGKWYHLIGLTLKDKKVTLYVLEFDGSVIDDNSDMEQYADKTPRESMKHSMQCQRNNSLHMHEFRCNGQIYEASQSISGSLKYNENAEAYILCMLMRQAGWQIEKDSVFYETGWDVLTLTEISLSNEYESLPDWSDNLSVLSDVMPQGCAVEIPIVLEPGKEDTINFEMKDGSRAECYINKVYLVDVWAEEEKKFHNREYREQVLQHMTEEEFENIKKHVMQTLAETCPQGKYYMVVEYECNKDISVSFYDRSYLDTVRKPKNGSAAEMFMRVRPDTETGSHGFKMRGCVIQTPLDADIKSLEAELFSYAEAIKKVEIHLYERNSKSS